MEIIILSIPLPRAWKVEPAIIQKPANRKLILINRRAGIPIVNISAEASNNPNS